MNKRFKNVKLTAYNKVIRTDNKILTVHTVAVICPSPRRRKERNLRGRFIGIFQVS
uniref:Uncharacterized protein n=1 Tax=Anguilla anguilla TaxID=7936 RepID=A0A0E9TDB7_ANGAN